MSADPKVWIVDDGELVEIRSLLQKAGLAFGEGEGPPDTQVQLLVTSTRHTLPDSEKRPTADTHLVVFEEESGELRTAMERSGCDLVMPHPLNAHAFTLLLSYALYEGREKRRSRRVLLTSSMKIRHERYWSDATLISLSLRGCGLITDSQLRVGRKHGLELPGSLTGQGELRLEGRILHSRPAAAGGFQSSLVFRRIDPEVQRSLAEILDQHGGGGELRPRPAPPDGGPAIGANHDDPGRSGKDREPRRFDDERGGGDRKRFTRGVLAVGPGISHVLIGRDLSAGGMRVRPDPELTLGDVLKLAVHGHPGRPAIMVKAKVVRCDGEGGMVLRFQELPDSIACSLEEMVSSLPSLPQGRQVGAAGPANILGEVLGRD